MKRKIVHARPVGEGYPQDQTIYISGERIVSREGYENAPGEEELLDAEGALVVPGLIDIHTHGCVGTDCCDASEEALHKIASYELSQGVVALTPTTMTVGAGQLREIARAARKARDSQGPGEAAILGLYMEGPFINPAKKGAQNEEHVLLPDYELLRELDELSGGMFKTVIVAPEREGAMEFIDKCQGRYRVSLGHMNADYETAKAAFDHGARQLTHTFNAMPGLSHRAPGPIGAAQDDERVMAELICDGIHVHPAMVRMLLRLFGKDRIIFISDSMRATGLQDGTYDLGGQEVFVKGKLATLADGTIAGSATNLMGCMRTAVKEMGIPLETAVNCASTNPARALGVEKDYGSLAPGHYASLVLLDDELNVRRVLHKGEVL